jgi:hypothetical protein
MGMLGARVKDVVVDRRCRRAFAAVPIALGCLCGSAVAARADQVTFSYTGAEQSYVVPARVSSVHVVAVGAPGGSGASSSGGAGGPGADGAVASGDLAVAPGEVLFVEVGGRGADGLFHAAPGDPNGGFNGGGFGNVNTGGDAGGGGGGASDVRTVSCGSSCPGSLGSPQSPQSLQSRLVVAGGGGGGGGAADPIFGTPAGGTGGGGGGGQVSGASQVGAFGASGAGGACAGTGGGGGSTYVPGQGGTAGAGTNACGGVGGGSGGFGETGMGSIGGGGSGDGGGGGGGFTGGGGGGGSGFEGGGGGGGGGSSYGPAGASFISDTSGVPSVTITAVPAPPSAAQATPSRLVFPGGTVGAASPLQLVTVTAAGGWPLLLTGVSFTGPNAVDFSLASSTCDGPLSVGQSCQLSVEFTPQASGTRTATLQISSDDPAGPTLVPLSGTATQPGSAPSPGVSGQSGPAANRRLELIACQAISKLVTRGDRRVRVTSRRCAAHPLSGTITSGGTGRATLSRGRLVYAAGIVVHRAGTSFVVLLTARRALSRGRYTLTVSQRHGRKMTTEAMTISLG